MPPATVAPTVAPPPAEPPPTTAPAPVVTEAPPTTPPTTAPAPTPTTVAPIADTPVTTVKPKAKAAKTKATTTGNLAANANAKGAVSLEVSIARQVMVIRKGGTVWKTINVSTGSGRRYCEKGKCGVSVTPRGRYRINNRISGWRTAQLGRIYNPLYFKGGFAVHGSNSVPRYPASHGCVRVSIANARWLPSVVPNGTPIWIH